MLVKTLYWLVRLLYRFRAYNIQSLNAPGPVLLLSNHVSWWDWIFIGVCLEEDWKFVTSSATADLSWVHRKIMVNRRTFPVDINSPYAIRHMAEYLQSGGRLVLFPEGRISTTGSLMKLFDGTGFLISKTKPKVITAYIRGAHRLLFSHNSDRKRCFPRISVHFSDILSAPNVEHASATDTRTRMTDWLRDRMLQQRFEVEMEFGPRTLPEAIITTAGLWPNQVITQDLTMQQLSYRRLMVMAELLQRQWTARLSGDTRVGVLLPNLNAMPVVLLSLWAANKIPAVLNYTTGPAILLACGRVAGLKHVITSRAFLERAAIDVTPLADAGIQFIFLEDIRGGITASEKFSVGVRGYFAPALQPAAFQAADDPAIILFTSGSEGDPKAVELTHKNLLANIRQMLTVIDLLDRDRFFNALPLFHSFGLTVGLLLPLVHGVFVFLYLSPLHYRIVPSAFYNLNCTVLFATNTFLLGYARKAHPYDFRTLRYLFAGAEKLQESTSAVWMRKFGVRILEGYGATECSPCVSVNVPMHPRLESAGQLLPGIDYKLEAVEGVSEQDPAHIGRLFVRGPNIMRGYLNSEANQKFKALGGWYDTGDIARIDDDRFVYILGRLKRFAKVSGEMVSLTAVEDVLAAAFPEYGLKFVVAVVTRADVDKGERLIAVTNEPRLTLEQIRQAIRARGLSNLAVPRELRLMHEIPRLGTGKINHRDLERLVRDAMPP